MTSRPSAEHAAGTHPEARLREIREADLPILFEHQRDPEATAMAVHASREWEAFVAHWRRNVLGNPVNRAQGVVSDGKLAGYVASWQKDDRRLVAYWLGREFWGRGLASAALAEFLRRHERERPVYAHVAQGNTRSIRVLEGAGFRRIDTPDPGPDGVVEFLFRLED